MDNFIEIRQMLMALVRRWWILLLGALLAGVLGYALSQLQTRVYTAITTIQVGRATSASNLERVDLQLSSELALTYADLVRRKSVLQGAVDTLQLTDTWQDLKDRVHVNLVDNTQLIEVSVDAGSPTEAQLVADEVARQLILRSPSAPQAAGEETKQFVSQRLKALSAKIETGQQRLSRLETEMTAALSGSISQLSALQMEVKELETLIAEWDSTYARLLTFLKVEAPVNHLTVVERAEANPTPIRPRVKLNTLLAAVLGFLLAGGVIFLLEYLDDTFRSTDMVSQLLGLVTLGGISRIKGKNSQEKLILRQDMYSPASEDYRLLRNRIQTLCADWPRKVIMVTSPTPGEMKSIMVANLGIVLAQAGYRVIIVDANIRQPVQHTLFQLPNSGGLTELLYEPKLEINSQLENTELKDLQVLPVGALPPPHPAELLGSARMGELLNRLAESADIVLCDSACAVAIADALVLSRHVDGVLLTVEMGKTGRNAAQQAVYNLQQAGANVLGIVLSPMSASAVIATKLKTAAASNLNGKYTGNRLQTVELPTNQRA